MFGGHQVMVLALTGAVWEPILSSHAFLDPFPRNRGHVSRPPSCRTKQRINMKKYDQFSGKQVEFEEPHEL